jgi:hypothetical protein
MRRMAVPATRPAHFAPRAGLQTNFNPNNEIICSPCWTVALAAFR